MKLSQLVAYKSALDAIVVANLQRQTNERLDDLMHDINQQDIKLVIPVEEFEQSRSLVNKGFSDFGNSLFQLRRQVQRLIETEGKTYFAESYRLYEEEMQSEPVDYILDRRMPMSEETESMISSRIKLYSGWHYPGMIIRPGRENFVTDMVSLDPLYLVDREAALLQPAVDKFPEEYQRRLRLYNFNEANDQFLEKIPTGQFGCCLVFNFFNFKPLEIIKQYLQEIFEKLRPGGMLLMTINDCDRAHCVALSESNFCCYTPGSMIRDLAISLGYEHKFSWDDKGNLSWIELKKPGMLTSLRGGQTLAKIMRK